MNKSRGHFYMERRVLRSRPFHRVTLFTAAYHFVYTRAAHAAHAPREENETLPIRRGESPP
jgi:hypothetical protein